MHILGDVTGNPLGQGGKPGTRPAIHITGALRGKILIDGSLINGSEPNDPEILADSWGEPPSFFPAIAVDYDGWDAADTWQTGATAKVGTTTYTGNTPGERRVWEISECKADMNNDGSVDTVDIEPFLLALLSSESNADYEEAYPGLGNYAEGSMIFHGDTNCDGSIDLVDVESFTQFITLGCCQATCPPGCGFGGGGGGGFAPELVGATMKAGLSKESQGTFGDMLIDFIAGLKIQEKIDYWIAVLVEFERK